MKNWIKEGLIFGTCMYILNILIFPWMFDDSETSLRKALIGLPVFLICGLGYGYFTRILYPKWMNKRKSD